MNPPFWCTTPYTVAKPSPTFLSRSFVVKNGSNSRPSWSGSMPHPLSLTASSTKSPGRDSRWPRQ